MLIYTIIKHSIHCQFSAAFIYS